MIDFWRVEGYPVWVLQNPPYSTLLGRISMCKSPQRIYIDVIAQAPPIERDKSELFPAITPGDTVIYKGDNVEYRGITRGNRASLLRGVVPLNPPHKHVWPLGFSFPDHPTPTPKPALAEHNSTCPRCGSFAYLGLFKMECPSCG